MRLKLPANLLLHALRYRVWITVAAVFVFILSIGATATSGAPLVMAIRPISAGVIVTAEDVATVYMRGIPSHNYVTDINDIVGKPAEFSTNAGNFVPSKKSTDPSLEQDRVIVSVALDGSDPHIFPIGSTLHLWQVDDAGSRLISQDAQVIEGSSSLLQSGNLVVSIPSTDEFSVMQALAVRVAWVG